MSNRSTVCILLVCFLGTCRAQLKPGCTISQLHACGEDYLVYSNSTWLPEPHEAQFKTNCELFTTQIECTLKFAERCLQNVPRAVAVVAMEAAGDDFEAACTEGNERYEMYKDSIKCMNLAGTNLNRCFGVLRTGLSESVEAPTGRTIHYACCSYHRALECTERSFDVCEPGSPAMEYVTNVMERIFGQVLSLVCGSYTRGSADCAGLPKLPPSSSPKTNLIELVIEVTKSLSAKKKNN